MLSSPSRSLRPAAALLAAVFIACSSGGSATVTQGHPASTTNNPAAPVTTAPLPTLPPPTRPPITAIGDCSPIPQAVGPPEPGAMETVGPVALFFEEAVGETSRTRVLDGVRAAFQYLTDSLGGFRFDEPVCFDVRGGSTRSSTVGVVYGANHVVLYTGARALTGSPAWLLSHVAAHEYMHFWQKDVGSPRDAVGPVWLLEGSAELLGYLAVTAAGVVGYDEARTYSVRRLPPNSISLTSMERRSNDPEEFSYPLAFFATELLTADAGPLSLRAYWRALSRGMTWEVAFTESFGVAPADFYTRFDEQRRRGFPR